MDVGTGLWVSCPKDGGDLYGQRLRRRSERGTGVTEECLRGVWWVVVGVMIEDLGKRGRESGHTLIKYVSKEGNE